MSTSPYDSSAVHCEVAEIKTWLSEWLSEWQGRLLCCPGQLKIYLYEMGHFMNFGGFLYFAILKHMDEWTGDKQLDKQ